MTVSLKKIPIAIALIPIKILIAIGFRLIYCHIVLYSIL